MKTRSLLVTAVATLALTASPTIYASPVSLNLPAHAFVGKAGSVKMAFRNDSGVPIELKAGDKIMKVDAGKTLSVNLPAGTRVVMNAATANRQAGEFITEVATYLNGATVSIQ